MDTSQYAVGEYELTTELENNLNGMRNAGYRVKFMFPPDMSQVPPQPKYVVIFVKNRDGEN